MMPLMITCFLASIVFPWMVCTAPTVMKPPVEFILLIDGSSSVGAANFVKLANVPNRWPQFFKISEQDSRVAVVQFADTAQIDLPLSGDEQKVRGLRMNYKNEWATSTGKGLKMIRDEVLADARPNAFKVIITLTDGLSTDAPQVKPVARQLREDGIGMYALFIGEDYTKFPNVKNHVDNDIAGDTERVFNIDKFDKLTEKFIEEMQLRIECNYYEVCRFKNPTTCESAWLRQETADQTCQNQPPTRFQRNCANISKCEAECDKWWPWEDANCDKNAGQSVPVNRLGFMPDSPKSVLDKCSQNTTVHCPTKATKVGQTTISATTKVETLSTQSVGPISTELLTSKEPALGQGNRPGNSESEPEGFPWWAILIIVVIIVLCISAAILGAVLVTRSKKKRSKTKRRREMEGARRAKPHEGIKSRGSISQEMSTVKVAEHSMGVSMADNTRMVKLGPQSNTRRKSSGLPTKKPKDEAMAQKRKK